MEVSKLEVAAVSQVEAPRYVAGKRTLVRSSEAGTLEYQAYRAKLDEIHALALAIRNAPLLSGDLATQRAIHDGYAKGGKS